jgi:hypothetical protein
MTDTHKDDCGQNDDGVQYDGVRVKVVVLYGLQKIANKNVGANIYA